jgi:hypothetical protein
MESMRSLYGSSAAMCIDKAQVEPSRYRTVARKVRVGRAAAWWHPGWHVRALRVRPMG